MKYKIVAGLVSALFFTSVLLGVKILLDSPRHDFTSHGEDLFFLVALSFLFGVIMKGEK